MSMGSIQEMPDLVIKDDRPLGIRVIENSRKRSISYQTYQLIVLLVTFMAYTSYHLTRKTTSIVKSALDPQSPDSSSLSLKDYPWQRNYLNLSNGNGTLLGSSSNRGWEPFNGPNGTQMLGYLDVAFLAVYAIGMFFSGHIGDRMNLRVFLTIGMVGTGLFTALFGFGYWFNIHNFYYYLVIQMFAGVLQSTGWPSVVAVVGNWLGKSGRGLVMGLWNAHTSVGNISGSLIASFLLKYGWGWSMFVPGLVIGFMGLVVFFFLPVSPLSVGMHMGDEEADSPKKAALEEPFIPALESMNESDDEEGSAVGFIQAWKIPGVANYALCLFFAKLVAYTFLYWLPFYISNTEIGGVYLSGETAGNLSTLFDMGGVIGGICAGFASDILDARALTAASFTYFTIPALYFYRNYGFLNLYVNGALMFITGMFVNGPYALITTAVSADLGTHESLRGNARALATVTAIIDGTGSIGAAIGPLLTGYFSAISWDAVFTMLMTAALIAGLLLTKLVINEIRTKIDRSRTPRSSAANLV